MLGLFALTPSLPVLVPTSETAQPLLSSDLPALHSRNIQAGQFAPGEPVPVYQYSQGQGEPVPMYQFAQGQGEPVPVYQYSSGMAAQPYANQHWAEVPPGMVAPQGAPAGYFYDGAPSAEPFRYDSGYGMPYSQPAPDEQCESDCADTLSKATGACLLVPTPLIAIVAPICYLAVAEAQAHCDQCPEIMCYSMAPGRTVYKNWWGLFGSPDEEPFFPFANPGLDYECKNDWADMLPDWGGREALEGICDMCEPVIDKYGSGRGRSLLLDNLHMGLISTSVDTAVDTKVDVGKDTAAKALDEMSPETIRALGGRKGLASLDEAQVGLVAEQAKLHAQDKLRHRGPCKRPRPRPASTRTPLAGSAHRLARWTTRATAARSRCPLAARRLPRA